MKRYMLAGLAAGAALLMTPVSHGAPYHNPKDFRFDTSMERVWELRMRYQLYALEIQRDPPPGPPGDATDFDPQSDTTEEVTLAWGGPAARPPQVKTRVLAPIRPNAWAAAQYNAAFNFIQATNKYEVAGTVVVDGAATATPPDEAKARSKGRVEARSAVPDSSGICWWKNQWRVVGEVSGDAADDPAESDASVVEVMQQNRDTGAITSTRLFSSSAWVEEEFSTFENGLLTINAMRGLVRIDMDSPFLTSPHGSMLLMFDNGIVTESMASGIFAGILPGVGSSSSGISMPLGDTEGYFELAYDFGETSAQGFDLTLAFEAEGEARDGIPAPATLSLLMCAPLCMSRRRRD